MVNIFKELERRLERTFEGAFSRAFTAEVKPLEIATEVRRALEDGVVDGVRRRYAPNLFDVTLSRRDHRALLPYFDAITAELADFVTGHAQQRGYALLGAPAINFNSSDRVSAGTISVRGRVDQSALDAAGLEEDRLEHTQMFTADDIAAEGLTWAPAYLEDVQSGARHYVSRFPARLGRMQSNDIVLEGLGVSRVHAEILYDGKRFTIRDLESTNGTFVNGRQVRERRLRDGDIIGLGESKLRWFVAR